jgi:hypothetical protein
MTDTTHDDLVKRLREIGKFSFGWIADRAADRIEELEAKLKTAEEIGRAFEEDAGQLRAKLAKAVEALKFYADADNYEDQHKPESCGCCYYLHDAEIKEDEGAKARATLAAFDKGGKDD